MKELEINTKSQIEISVKKKQEIEYKIIGSIVPHKGHVLWEVNNETQEVKEVKFQNTTYVFGEEFKKEVLVKQNHTYISALNKKNALKKYMKGSNGSKPIDQNPLMMGY